MGYDVLELRELERERYARHPAVLKGPVLPIDQWREESFHDTCEIYINGTRLQELVNLPVDAGDEMPWAIGYFEVFPKMLTTSYRGISEGEYGGRGGFYPILWDLVNDPLDGEGDVTVHLRLDRNGRQVIWDGFFEDFGIIGLEKPLPGPIFRFSREQYESAIRTFARKHGIPCP